MSLAEILGVVLVVLWVLGLVAAIVLGKAAARRDEAARRAWENARKRQRRRFRRSA